MIAGAVRLAAVAALLGCGGGSGGATQSTSGEGTGSGPGTSSGYAPVECASAGSSSHVGEDGRCYCDADTTWANPFDPNDASCIEVGTRAGEPCDSENGKASGDACTCVTGFRWCSENTTDLRCCFDDAQEHLGGATSTSDGEGSSSGTSATADTGNAGSSTSG